MTRHSVLKRSVVGLVVLMSAACATTPGPILAGDVGGIRTAITAARQQASDSFAASNNVARQQAIEWKAREPDAILRPTDFPLVVPTASAVEWDNVFGILDSYAAALQDLVDDKRAKETGDSIASLGKALSGSSVLRAKIPGGLTAAFSEFGEALVQARSERNATGVMRSTDPAFHRVVDAMAAAIGEPSQPGSLANTVEAQWDDSVLPLIENDYARVPPSDLDRRRQLLQSYTQALAGRDRQLGDLSQLKRSLLALAAAHSAAARGKSGDALFWIGRVNGWADEMRARMTPAQEPKQ